MLILKLIYTISFMKSLMKTSLVLAAFGGLAMAGDGAAYAINNVIMFICAVLVLLMQAGFAMLESGLNGSKNTVNILSKNIVDMCFGILLYFFVGYNLMYGGADGGWLHLDGMLESFKTGTFVSTEATSAEDVAAGALYAPVDYLFQAAFAAAAATIVSGAIAGRMKFSGYIIFSAIITGILYPISGMWGWGGGSLSGDDIGFSDYAGSMIVHGFGGFSALAAAIVLGARKGRFVEGKAVTFPGHNLAQATLGTFLLFIGWFGFNPGSELAYYEAANVQGMLNVAVNTALAAAAGGIGALALGWAIAKKADLSMVLNGVLGGLVAICCACGALGFVETVFVGLIAGVLVVAGVYLLDILRIDDAVGAFPVHGICGVWGALTPVVFVTEGYTWSGQLAGVFAYAVWGFVTSFALFSLLRLVGQGRVSEEIEAGGLDEDEHAQVGYAGFEK